MLPLSYDNMVPLFVHAHFPLIALLSGIFVQVGRSMLSFFCLVITASVRTLSNWALRINMMAFIITVGMITWLCFISSIRHFVFVKYLFWWFHKKNLFAMLITRKDLLQWLKMCNGILVWQEFQGHLSIKLAVSKSAYNNLCTILSDKRRL